MVWISVLQKSTVPSPQSNEVMEPLRYGDNGQIFRTLEGCAFKDDSGTLTSSSFFQFPVKMQTVLLNYILPPMMYHHHRPNAMD
jgi:hypothetical protein